MCLDSSVIIPYLVPEEDSQKAEALIQEAISSSMQVLTPCFAWVKVGSVLLKKVRRGLLTAEESQACFADFQQLPLKFIEHPDLRNKAWAIAVTYNLSTLYDAAFFACAEHAGAEFWTADQLLVKSLSPCPSYVYLLADS